MRSGIRDKYGSGAPSLVHTIRLNEYRQPSGTMMLEDGGPQGYAAGTPKHYTWNAWTGDPKAGSAQTGGSYLRRAQPNGAFRHVGKVLNSVFADGHTRALKASQITDAMLTIRVSN